MMRETGPSVVEIETRPVRPGRRPLAAALGLSVLLAMAWTWRVESHGGRAKVIKFAYLSSPQDARHLSALTVKESIESASNGAIRVELYYGGQLGGRRDAIEGVKLGTIEMTVAGAGIFANFEPRMGITALPFLFDSIEQAWAFNDSALNARVCDRLLRKGIRVLGHWDNGFRCVTNSRRPILTPSDLRGLKIRTPENPIVLATMSALGANPSPLPWPELYMALQQEAFDGQENPIPTIYVNKLYEVQTFLSITNHVYEPMPVVISEVFWKRLSADEQQLIRRAVQSSQRFNRQLIRRQTREGLTRLAERGMVVTRPDREPFRRAVAGVRETLVDSIGSDLIDAAYRFDASESRTP